VFFDSNNDVKSIITKHLSSDYKTSTMFMSKHYHLQKIFFGEIVFEDDFHKIKKLHDDIHDDDDFNNGKIYKISHIVNDFFYICAT
jgi:hypothetical protein